jgi:hypothetical protein
MRQKLGPVQLFVAVFVLRQKLGPVQLFVAVFVLRQKLGPGDKNWDRAATSTTGTLEFLVPAAVRSNHAMVDL